jgi:hypothetical protein
MRSLLLRVLISVFLLSSAAQAEESLNLFVIEKPIEHYDANELNSYLSLSMSDLLVRLVGDANFSQSPEAKKYIEAARQWVQRFQLMNKEVDGVVIGRSLLVEFDRQRLLSEFQKDAIHIWPQNYRPKTWLVGQWEQRGLLENISQQNLEYRVDLDYRTYGRLLGLPLMVPANQEVFDKISLFELINSDTSLSEDLLNQLVPQSHFVLFYKADLIGDVVSWAWALYSTETGALVQRGEEVGESFLDLVNTTLDNLLDFYSAPYRQAIGSLGLIELDIENVTEHAVFNQIESALAGFKPTINEVRLTEVEGDRVQFEIIYNGQLSNLLDNLDRLEHVKWVESGFFQGKIKGRYTHE